MTKKRQYLTLCICSLNCPEGMHVHQLGTFLHDLEELYEKRTVAVPLMVVCLCGQSELMHLLSEH